MEKEKKYIEEGFIVFFTVKKEGKGLWYEKELFAVKNASGELINTEEEEFEGYYYFEDKESAESIFNRINAEYLKENSFELSGDITVYLEEVTQMVETDSEGHIVDLDFEYKKILETDFYYAGN